MRENLWLTLRLVVGLLAFLWIESSASAQTVAPNEWTRMSGEITIDNPGIYGTLGTPSAANLPGARLGSASWTDANGNLWLFGGFGYDSALNVGYLNDLWEFDPATNAWAWMGGSSLLQATCYGGAVAECGHPGIYGALRQPGSQNVPGGRYYASYWTDKNGDFWLFGGAGYDVNGNLGELNDLWEFNPSTNLWTWMGGSDVVGSNGGQPGIYGTMGTPWTGNIPGGRESGMTWVDSNGNLWLYGGEGFDAQGNGFQLNDVWEFNPSTNEWTWVNGTSTVPASCVGNDGGICGQVVSYGAFGVSASGNNPGGRLGAATWTDNNGDFWLYGGTADSTGQVNSTSASLYDQYDLWTYSPSTNQWTWMGGNSDSICGVGSDNYWCSVGGVSGAVGVPTAAGLPSARSYAMAWTDSSGNFWLNGGLWSSGPGGSGASYANDLWAYLPSEGEWAPMNGANSGTPPGWGTQGLPAPGNLPSPRFSAATWTDKAGNFWLFGGQGYGADTEYPGTYNPFVDLLNDLWVYEPVAPAPVPSFSLSSPPNPVYALVGNNVIVPIEVIAADGFTFPVSLSVVAATLPSGITASISPSTITGSGTAMITFNVGSGATPYFAGYTIAVTGSSGSITQSSVVRLMVTGSAPSFSLQASPGSFSVTNGQSGTGTITLTPANGFSGQVNFSCSVSGSPGGLSCSVPSTSVNAALVSVAPLTVETTSSTLLGNYQATITGSDAATGSITASASFALNVTAAFGAPSGFQPGTISIAPGAVTGNTTGISVVGNNGFSGTVNLSCSIAPVAASDPPTCVLSPASLALSGTTSQNSALTVNTTAATSAEDKREQIYWPGAADTALVFVVLLAVPRRRRTWMAVLLMFVIAFGASSCGGGGSGGGGSGGGGSGGGGNSGSGNAGTPPGTYTVRVTGTSGGISATITSVTLIVN